MKKIISDSTKRFISILILGALVFSFLHSELGWFNFDDGHHETHDYCQIVDGKTHQINKTVNNQLPKPSIEKIVYIHCIKELADIISISPIRIKNDFLIHINTIDLFLQHSSFLI